MLELSVRNFILFVHAQDIMEIFLNIIGPYSGHPMSNTVISVYIHINGQHVSELHPFFNCTTSRGIKN